MADDEDELDPVVEEIDVYLAKTLSENIHLFQYPTRPAAVTYDKTTCLAARVKPKQQKVMLEMSLNTTGANYCTSKGEQFAYEADHGMPDDKKFFESDVMDKQVLLSSQGTMSTSQYAVGLMKEGEIHLTPLKGIVQLRPSFEYLDRKKDVKTTQGNDEGDSQDEDEDKMTTLSVRFAKKESEYAKAQRLSSYRYLEKQMAEEEWSEVKYHGINEQKSVDERDSLFCQEMNTEVLEFDPSPSNYIENLLPTSQPEIPRTAKLTPENTVSITHLKKLQMVDQVKCLLINAKVMSFSELCSLLHPPPNEQAVLKCLAQQAILVQGCWVVKSEVLYPKGEISAFSTATAECLCRGRDYILYRFTKSRSIQRSDIMAVIKLTTDDVNDIIHQVAKRNVLVGWEFKLPFDQDFVKNHPDIVEQQESFWTTKYRTLCEKLKIGQGDAKMKEEEKSASQVKETSDHDSQNFTIPDKVSRMEVDLPNGFCENNEIKSGEADEESCDELSAEDQNKRFERLMKFVKDKLNTGCLSLAEFKKLILLHQTAVSPGDILSTGVSDTLLLKAIDKCGGEELDLKWPTSTQYPSDLNSRRIFAMRAVDTSLDKYRGAILDLFRGSFGVKRKTIMEKTKELFGSSPSSMEYSKLIQELGLERKGNIWYIRGTLCAAAPK